MNKNRTKSRCVIIAAYQSARISDSVDIGADDLILCADGGYAHARAEGITPHVLIGDFDSLTADEVTEGVEVIRLDTEKDYTDTLACAKYGIGKGIDDFVIVGGIGGRFDHTVANLQTLSFLTDMRCRAWIADGKNRATMVDSVKKNPYELIAEIEGPVVDALGSDFGEESACGSIVLDARADYKFSVYSYEERSTGVNISGAKYPLNDAVLTQSFPIGTSNEFLGTTPVTISVKHGRLLVILSRD
ncbi:MAG: thiamine diphosphokinase [Clostridiales Family XIII bacterium]|jgi:thiamine pyrophosphokinase|nr:thiamine diphosphokinase [Clostridiales Family XIII bacterium]